MTLVHSNRRLVEDGFCSLNVLIIITTAH